MDIKIKKKLVKNWFISLQEIICSEIIKIEKKNAKFKQNLPEKTNIRWKKKTKNGKN